MAFTYKNALSGIPAIIRLDSIGNGTGVYNANGNYSAGVQFFQHLVPSNRKFALNTIQATIADNVQFQLAGYGGQATSLTNGLSLTWQSQGIAFQSSVNPIKTTLEFLTASTVTDEHTFAGGDIVFEVYFDILSINALPIILEGSRGDFFRFSLNDDFSFLIQHRFTLFGAYI